MQAVMVSRSAIYSSCVAPLHTHIGRAWFWERCRINLPIMEKCWQTKHLIEIVVGMLRKIANNYVFKTDIG